MAQNPPDYRGNDPVYSTDGCLLSLGGHRVLVESANGFHQRKRRRSGCLDQRAPSVLRSHGEEIIADWPQSRQRSWSFLLISKDGN